MGESSLGAFQGGCGRRPQVLRALRFLKLMGVDQRPCVLSAVGPTDRSLFFPPAGHFMQRGDSWQGSHTQVCGCHEMEIQGEACDFVMMCYLTFSLLQVAAAFLCMFLCESLEIVILSRDRCETQLL